MPIFQMAGGGAGAGANSKDQRTGHASVHVNSLNTDLEL